MLRRTRRRVDPYWQRRDLLALAAMAPLGGQFFPLTEWSLRPAALLVVLNEVFVHRRASVVECGSGNSTLAVGRLLRRTGGHVVALEDDERWAAAVDRAIADERLGDHATVVHAPLRARDGESPWYDRELVRAALRPEPIDLLVVDGPGGHLAAGGTARSPAVPFVRDRLAGDYTVMLDDANLRGERAVVRDWAALLGIEFDHAWRIGLAIGRSHPAPRLSL